MLPQSALTGTTARLPIDIRRFPWIRRLAADYAFDYARLADFFAGNPADASAWADAITRTQRHARSRDAVADLVQAQQRRRGAPPEAIAATAQLRDPTAVAVVTGQQAGLFGGPLFTLLKALTAIKLAERVRAEHRVPAVAVFWIDSEDHDWDEVKSVGVLDGDLNLQHISLGDPAGAHQGPVARVQLDESAGAALAALEAALPGTEFTPELLQTLRTIYRPGAGMAEAFGQWLEEVLGPHGLIVFEASDPAAKPIASSVFRREIEHPGRTSQLAAEAGAALQARGYHAQVTPHEGSVALFHLDGGREPIRHQDGGYQWGDARATQAELLARVAQSPHEFSPNVLLRPLVQDTLFPTVCYVAGPSELAYLGQLGGVYAAFGIPDAADPTPRQRDAPRLQRHAVPRQARFPAGVAARPGRSRAQPAARSPTAAERRGQPRRRRPHGRRAHGGPSGRRPADRYNARRGRALDAGADAGRSEEAA